MFIAVASVSNSATQFASANQFHLRLNDKTSMCMFVLHSNAAELVDKYKLDIARLEEITDAKNTEIETLQASLQFTETMLSTQIKELHEKCKMSEQQKGDSKICWILLGSLK